MKPTYLAIDTESGGLSDESSLLTVYMAVLDEDMQVIDELDLKIQSSDGRYVCNDHALSINNINIEDHHRNSIPIEGASRFIYDFLYGYTICGTNKLTVVGHDVSKDVHKICTHLLDPSVFYTFTHKLVLDTLYVSFFMNKAKAIRANNGFSLGAVAQYFDVEFLGVQHDARADALTSAKIMKEMLKYV